MQRRNDGRNGRRGGPLRETFGTLNPRRVGNLYKCPFVFLGVVGEGRNKVIPSTSGT